MQMRPCFNSTYRRRSNFSWSASATNPRGSKKPRAVAKKRKLSKSVAHQGKRLENRSLRGWAPRASSKAERAVEEAACCLAGAKAAADAKREATDRATNFILIKQESVLGKIIKQSWLSEDEQTKIPIQGASDRSSPECRLTK